MPREKKTHEVPRLRELRLRAGLTMRRLSELSKVSKDTILRIEQGRLARLDTIEALAAALGVTEKDLMGWPGWPEEQVTAYLDELARKKKTYGPGDVLYDTDPTLGRSDAEIAQFVLENPEVRGWVEILLNQRKRMSVAIELADEELNRLPPPGRGARSLRPCPTSSTSSRGP